MSAITPNYAAAAQDIAQAIGRIIAARSGVSPSVVQATPVHARSTAAGGITGSASFTLSMTINSTVYSLTVSIPAPDSGSSYTFELQETPSGQSATTLVNFSYTSETDWNLSVSLPTATFGPITLSNFDISIGAGS